MRFMTELGEGPSDREEISQDRTAVFIEAPTGPHEARDRACQRAELLATPRDGPRCGDLAGR